MASLPQRFCLRRPIFKLAALARAAFSEKGFSTARGWHSLDSSGVSRATLVATTLPTRSRVHYRFSRCLSSGTTHWKTVVSQAEKVIGMEAPRVSLDGLFDGEVGNGVMNSYMSKLLSSKHPLASYAKDWVCGEDENSNTRALIVLLVSKAASPLLKTSTGASHSQTGIIPSQIELAEILEMIHTAYFVHRRIVKTSVTMATELQDDLTFGNKMAVLSGDFLLSNACLRLAQLYNTQVVDIISSAISDMMEGFMMGSEDLALHHLDMDLWLKLIFKCKGSLLAKGCQSALKLAGHSEEIQNQAFSFAINLCYSHQLQQEFELCRKNYPDSGIPVASLPVMFSKNDGSMTQVLQGLTLDDHLDATMHSSMLENSMSQNHVAENIEQFMCFYSQEALHFLDYFPDSDAKTCLLELAREPDVTV